MYTVIVNEISFLLLALPPAHTLGGKVILGACSTSFCRESLMQLYRGTTLLFGLNLLDALLTIVWVRSGVATEGNQLMARLLEIGDFTFLGAKIVIGGIAALVLLRWGNLKLAQYGLTVALAVYISLMGVHIFTGLSAFGLISLTPIQDFAYWTKTVFASFI